MDFSVSRLHRAYRGILPQDRGIAQPIFFMREDTMTRGLPPALFPPAAPLAAGLILPCKGGGDAPLQGRDRSRPNLLFILADNLGYGNPGGRSVGDPGTGRVERPFRWTGFRPRPSSRPSSPLRDPRIG